MLRRTCGYARTPSNITRTFAIRIYTADYRCPRPPRNQIIAGAMGTRVRHRPGLLLAIDDLPVLSAREAHATWAGASASESLDQRSDDLAWAQSAPVANRFVQDRAPASVDGHSRP